LCYYVAALLELPRLLATMTLPAVVGKTVLQLAVATAGTAALAVVVALCMRSIRKHWLHTFAVVLLFLGVCELLLAVVDAGIWAYVGQHRDQIRSAVERSRQASP
jgi:hypothetical protein